MSFDLFLTKFGKDNSALFPRYIVENAFKHFIVGESFKSWDIHFPDGSGGYLYIDRDKFVSGFGVNRPPASPIFWKIIADLLEQIPGLLLHWPGGGCVTAHEETIALIPSQWIDGLGAPVVTSDPARIIDMIESG